MDPTSNLERMTMSEYLDLMQRQIVDLQERMTAVEQTPAESRSASGGLDLLPMVVKMVGAVARAASDAGEVDAGERPVRRSLTDALQAAQAAKAKAPKRGAFAEWLAAQQAAAEPVAAAPQFTGRHAAEDHEHVHVALPPEVAATIPQQHENTTQRAELNPNLVSLWNAACTEHVDAQASQMSAGTDVRRLRVRHSDRGVVQEFLRDHDGDLHVRWRGASYRLRSVSAPRGHLDLEIEPELDEPRHIELPKPWEAIGRAMASATEPPCSFPHPDRLLLCDRPEGHQGPHNAADTAHSSGRIIIWSDHAELGSAGPGTGSTPPSTGTGGQPGGPVGTVTSGLKCSKCYRAKLLGHDDGQIADHAYNCPRPASAPDVDEVLPMPVNPARRAAMGLAAPGYTNLLANLHHVHDAAGTTDGDDQ